MSILYWREWKIYYNSVGWWISIHQLDWTWVTMRDKNVWASVVWNQWDTMSETNCWKFFQLGNNYWFPYTGATNTDPTTVDASAYGPSNPYSSSTFITVTPWDNSNNMNLWWGTSSLITDKQWPCPSWSHVPTYSELSKLEAAMLRYQTDAGKSAYELLHLPEAWMLKPLDGSLDSNMAFYWICDNWWEWYSNIENIFVTKHYSHLYITPGYSIRPFMDTPIVPDNSWTLIF